MTTAVVDSPDNEQGLAWWFLDTLVVEHRCAPEMDTVVLEMTLPVGSAPPLHVSCRATPRSRPWTNWRASLRPMTSGQSGLP